MQILIYITSLIVGIFCEDIDASYTGTGSTCGQEPVMCAKQSNDGRRIDTCADRDKCTLNI